MLGVEREHVLDFLERRFDLVRENIFPSFEIGDLLEILPQDMRPGDIAGGNNIFGGEIGFGLKSLKKGVFERFLDIFSRMGRKLGQANEFVSVERVERAIDQGPESFDFGGFENGFSVVVGFECGFGFIQD